MDSYANLAIAALKKHYTTLWQAAQAYDAGWSGGRLVTELRKDTVDGPLKAFVEKQTGLA